MTSKRLFRAVLVQVTLELMSTFETRKMLFQTCVTIKRIVNGFDETGGSPPLSYHLPLQHFDRRACTAKISYEKRLSKITEVHLIFQRELLDF